MSTIRAPRPKRPAATFDDLRAQWDDDAVELLDGALVEKASPDFFHGLAQASVLTVLGPPFGHLGGSGRGPGGWWFAAEVDLQFGEPNVLRPDLAGWRRETLPAPPSERPLRARPDWICEVLSATDRRRDQVPKLRIYQRHGVPHYWLVDPEERTLTVYRWHLDGFLNVLAAQSGETVRAEPFDALELPVGALFGEEPAAPGRAAGKK
jgi:Uma2 family endonuclease